VALARSIVSQQPVCLMDEPLSNLDAKLRNEMRDEIRLLQQQLGLTMIYVTHDQTEAMTMADQVVLLRDGRIEQAGLPYELYERPSTAFGARFIGSPPMNLIAVDRIEESALQASAVGAVPPGNGARGWSLGIRPEHVRLDASGLPAKVAAVDFLGAETILRMQHRGQVLFARLNGRVGIEPGALVQVSWPADAVHYFDREGIRQDIGGAVPSVPA
jgi:sn-glycerol 3-phosphate transport system ATP-binding protein